MEFPIHVALTLTGSAFPTEEVEHFVFRKGTTVADLLEVLKCDPEKTTVYEGHTDLAPVEELEDYTNYIVVCNGIAPENN